MKIDGLKNAEGLKDFSLKNSNDISSNTTYELYRSFIDSEENLIRYGEKFSDFYYISCYIPYEVTEECEDKIIQGGGEGEQWISILTMSREDRIKYSKEQWMNGIEKRKILPGIHDILKSCNYSMEDGHPIEILIGKYSEETMEKARKMAEEKRKEFEGSGINISDPKAYLYIVGSFGGTAGRTNQGIIEKIREKFPEKVKLIKLE